MGDNEFTALVNIDLQINAVELPVRYTGLNAHERSERAKAALNAVGLSNKMKNMPRSYRASRRRMARRRCV